MSVKAFTEVTKPRSFTRPSLIVFVHLQKSILTAEIQLAARLQLENFMLDKSLQIVIFQILAVWQCWYGQERHTACSKSNTSSP